MIENIYKMIQNVVDKIENMFYNKIKIWIIITKL